MYLMGTGNGLALARNLAMERKFHFVATEIDLTDGCNHVCYHMFEASDYRSLLSYSAFFTSGKYRCRTKTRLYHGKRKLEWEQDRAMMAANPITADLYIDVPVVNHESLWDFYKYIGYDYKKKKHLKDMGR